MENSADDDEVIEGVGRQQRTGGLQQHAAACGYRLRAARHDRPLHVQRTTAVALIGGQPQVVDKHGESGQREVMREHDPDAQRRPRGALGLRKATYDS